MNKIYDDIWKDAALNLNSKSWDEKIKFLEDYTEMIVNECCKALSPELRDMISRSKGCDLIREKIGIK